MSNATITIDTHQVVGSILKSVDLNDLHGKVSDFILREPCHLANRLIRRKCPLCGE